MIIQLSPDYRVRVLDELQWVLEQRLGIGGGRWKAQAGRLETRGEGWRPYAYCRTKAGLETALSRLRCDRSVHLDASLIAHLPDFFPEAKEVT